MNHIKVKTFSLIFLLFTSFAYSNSNEPYNLGISVFKDYENIKKLLQEKQKQNDRAAILLSNVKLYSIDYSPSPFVRTNRPNPSFPTQQAQDGIEGYAVVTFNINDDGSTSDHYISDSSPGKYFDEVSLESAKNLRYAFREPTNEREHSYRFAFTLNERSRKLPNAYFSCLDLIKKTRFSEAKSCAQSRNKFTENVLGMAYKIIIAEADFYLGDRDGAIDMLYKIINDESQESFYLKALAITNLTAFLFDEERYADIISLEKAINEIRKLGYEEQLIDSHYYLAVSHFYSGNKVDSLFFLKLSLQDTNCKQTLRLEPGESFIDWKKNSLYRLYPDKVCYSDFYARSIKTLEAINEAI